VFHHPIGLKLNTSAILDGFTIRNGYATGSNPHDRGAGMYNDGASPTVTGCRFFLNDAGNYGGGIYNTNASSPVITECTFDTNFGRSNGGGGIFNYDNCSPDIRNCLFINNFTAGSGGGIRNDTNSHPTISNCTFDSNTASNYAGGIYTTWSCAPSVTNCTFFGNTGAWGGGSFGSYNASPEVTNCILWGSTQNEIYIGGTTGTPSFTYCDIQVDPGSPVIDGTGNIKGTPMFTNPGSGDFHLKANSPCINSGSDAAATVIANDFEGDPRIVGTVDMGVDEAAVDVDVLVNLQGSNRPPDGWAVPITIGFYPPNSPDDWLLNPASAMYSFSGTTSAFDTVSGTRAFFSCPEPVAPGTYDITADSSTTLLNVKRSVHIQ